MKLLESLLEIINENINGLNQDDWFMLSQPITFRSRSNGKMSKVLLPVDNIPMIINFISNERQGNYYKLDIKDYFSGFTATYYTQKNIIDEMFKRRIIKNVKQLSTSDINSFIQRQGNISNDDKEYIKNKLIEMSNINNNGSETTGDDETSTNQGFLKNVNDHYFKGTARSKNAVTSIRDNLSSIGVNAPRVGTSDDITFVFSNKKDNNIGRGYIYVRDSNEWNKLHKNVLNLGGEIKNNDVIFINDLKITKSTPNQYKVYEHSGKNYYVFNDIKKSKIIFYTLNDIGDKINDGDDKYNLGLISNDLIGEEIYKIEINSKFIGY